MNPLDLLAPVAGCIRSDVWPRELVLVHNIADGIIALAYLAIPGSLVYLRHKRNDIPVDWITLCFAAFILLCGATHTMGIVTAWHPIYRLDGLIKAMTAGVSIATAYLLQVRVMPQLLRIPDAATSRREREETERARAEAEAVVAQLQVTNVKLSTALAQVEQHAAAIRELSTPVLALAPRVLLSPIIGALDSVRADQLTTAILDAVAAKRATVVIVDLTGVPVVDTQVADVLLRCARATALLGARTILTGMRPAVARTCVDLDLNLDKVITLGTIEDGLSRALQMVAS